MTNLPLPFKLVNLYKSCTSIEKLAFFVEDSLSALNLHHDLIANSPELILTYAYFTKQRLPEAEHLLVNPKHAYSYVCYIDEPIKNVEAYIANDCEYSYWYAASILKKPFPLGEPLISKSAYWSYWYAVNVIRNRFYLGEQAIYDSKYKIKYMDCFGIHWENATSYSTPREKAIFYSIPR